MIRINGNALKRLKSAKNAKLLRRTGKATYKGNMKIGRTTEVAEAKPVRKIRLKRSYDGSKPDTMYKVKNDNGKLKDYHIDKVKAERAENKKVSIEKLDGKSTELPKWLDKHFNSGTRLRDAALAGAGVGIAQTIMDSQDDDTFSAAGNLLKDSAIGVAASYGGEIGLSSIGITSKHLAQSEVAKQAKKVMTEAEEVRWQNNMKLKAGVTARIGIAAIGVASLVDIGSRLADDRKATVQRNQQEQDLIKQQTREKQRQAEMGYGYVDYGQIVIQQWQKRVGHYMMGNAKFQ